LFAGDLGNEVTDDLLTKTFSKYPSFLMAKVVRDKRTQKSKGYGFISFSEPDDFARAWKEMNGNQTIDNGCRVNIIGVDSILLSPCVS